MKYKDLERKTEMALRAGLQCILNNYLPSYWDNNGYGWHEQWMNADYSGVYAACEGVILLSQARQYIAEEKYAEIVNSVYKCNLCIIFDELIEIDATDKLAVNKRIQRDKALNSAYKLAKFLWASSYVDKDKNCRLENKIADSLYGLFDCKNRLFKNTRSAKKGSILATAFSYIALKLSGHVRSELESVEECFIEYLNNVNQITDVNIDQVIFIIWSVSQTICSCNRILIDKCVELLNILINNQDVKHNLIVGERYNIKTAGIRDSFSVNKHFIFIQALEAFIQSRKISFNCIRGIVSEINNIASFIMKNEMYSRDGRRESVLFWENYYALQLLNDFSIIIADSDWKEDEFMIISPKLFLGDDYTIDEKLCVVIMPFKVDWSFDMYETFKEAAIDFSVWRSDEEYTDDIIIQTVWEKINRAKFVIADCTGKNPNVFYELGIAHTLGKPVFMCSQNREDFPFDINHIRNFEYGLKPGEIRKLKEEIGKFIKGL
ncbi:MAG: hypothetical protein K2G63_03470 [Oscillospiraceae bacterium]|nr:hypothetical protein [Oscillospiraceae bacterium]